jgi:large subunit ribosomal protein L25
MSMEIIKLNATPRPLSGKGPSRRLRKSAQIPAVAYGRELKATQLAVSPKALLGVLTSPHGKNSVVELHVEGGDNLTVMVRDYSYHPLTRELQHADFLQIKLDQPIDVEVPFICTGKAKGLVSGGILQQVFRRIPIRALPEKIPVSVEVDVTELDMNESLKASQIKLTEGVTIRLPAEQTVVVVAAPEKATEEETAAKPGAPGAPGAAPAAGAAAAPATGAAPAKGAAAAPAAGAKAGDKGAAPAKAAAAPAKDAKKK